jgi:predicted HTH domain antitoxin
MNQLSIDLPDEALAALGLSPEEATREARRILALAWFEQGRITQGTGARIAGLSRHDFLLALGMAKISPIQVTADELSEEMTRGVVADLNGANAPS